MSRESHCGRGEREGVVENLVCVREEIRVEWEEERKSVEERITRTRGTGRGRGTGRESVCREGSSIRKKSSVSL